MHSSFEIHVTIYEAGLCARLVTQTRLLQVVRVTFSVVAL